MRMDSPIENVQRSFTRIPPSIAKKPYEDRLKIMGLTTHQKRRERGDLIETYKITNDYYSSISRNIFQFNTNNLRGHSKKLLKERSRKEERRNFIVNRIFTQWNNLPEEVISAISTNQFKNRLDEVLESTDGAQLD
uniref:Uncharacterized protein n=1 Tax=Cacopsylla melanoneura TaxID=428564 RepID=A0A8D8ZP43_9HEMI